MCEDKELLVGYLYDDLPDADRARFEAHLRACGECRTEVKAMRAVRADLAAWAPPEPGFGFRVVRGGRDASERDVIRPPAAAPLSWRAWWTPAAGLAAAAVLVLAAAASLAHVEVHRGPDGVTVRTGWSTAAPAGASAKVNDSSPNGQGGVAGSVTPPIGEGRFESTSDAALIAGLERRLNLLEAALRSDSGLRTALTQSARKSDEELIKRMREMLAQSEIRQQGELQFRISQVIRDVDAQRVADLRLIQRGLSTIDATVNAEAERHSDMRNAILSMAKQK